jgi:hypothetical protein
MPMSEESQSYEAVLLAVTLLRDRHCYVIVIVLLDFCVASEILKLARPVLSFPDKFVLP